MHPGSNKHLSCSIWCLHHFGDAKPWHPIHPVCLYSLARNDSFMLGAECISSPNFQTCATSSCMVPELLSLRSSNTTRSASAPTRRLPLMDSRPSILAGVAVTAAMALGKETLLHLMKLFRHSIKVTAL